MRRSLRVLLIVSLKGLSAVAQRALPGVGRKVLPAVAAFALLLVAASAARACTCLMSGSRPCARAWSAPVVFAGVVTEAADASQDAEGGRQRVYRFEVEESFRGGRGGTTEVLTGWGGGDCGYAFVAGQRYLVYANTDAEGRLTTSICSATRPLEEAAADVEFFRALPRLPAEAAVYGRVQFSGDDITKGERRRNEPVREARLLVEGGGVRREVSTDAGGKFEAKGLPPGTYTVKLVKPERMGGLRKPWTVELRERQCADVSFWLTWGAGVSGRVVGESGEPVRVRVTLAPPGLPSEELEDDDRTLTAYTREDGSYSFVNVPPGRYLLVVNVHGAPRVDESPYPRSFLPGVEDRRLATVLKVGDGEKLSDQNVRLPRRLGARELTGTVVWPDGRAAGKNTSAYLYFYTATLPRHDINTAQVDEQGRFTLKGWEGETFVVTATANLEDGKQVCAGPVEVTLDERAEAVRLVLKTPYGNCLADYRPAPKGR